MHKRFKVMMIVGGFPNPEQPYKGIFHLRAAKQLSQVVDVNVISMRAWYFGRKRIQESNVQGISVYTITAPQLPGQHLINLQMYNHFAWPIIKPLIDKCDLVHSVGVDGPGIIGCLWAHKCNKPSIIHIIGSDVFDSLKNNRKLREYNDWYKYISGGVAVSQAIADEFAQLIPSAKPTQVIHRGTDLELYKPYGQTIKKFNDIDGLRFLYMCGFPPANRPNHDLARKGGKNLLQAWKSSEEELKKSGAVLIIAGPNSSQDHIKKIVDTFKYAESVFLIGALHPDEVPDYMRSTDVVLVPHLEVGLPNVAQEGLASGKAVIGSNVGGMKEIIEDGVNGLLLPLSTDISAWGDALIKMSNNRKLVKQMGIEARNRAEKLLDKHNFAPKVFALYEDIIKDHKQV